ncbi:LEAF RUST 10 DISEASE-RESISTANCE LOCUS RECEPTOR-LIKE PROTEIN KINASE-like 1.2 isoform X2 [Silene latifolia]|uniref:LEAF RUST 10 DISEASE-RESISTANCE LOCUS RECEPTOR-LIKE PROTEIN KINASE-like 1.2 isoform X2 n=1 Tax=Silene latifolia TaxID=37657 RepID=UPI003D78611E
MIRLCCFSNCNNLMFKLTFFLQLKLYFSLSANHFGDCIPKKCGNLNISYPFYMIDKQYSYCGYPGFEVSCKDDNFPYINISGSSYVVKNVSYEEQTIQVVNSMLLESSAGQIACSELLGHLNLTASNDKFKYTANHSISLVLDCPQKVLQEHSPNWVICGAVGVYEDESRLKEMEGKCNGGVVSVPYEGETMKNGNVTEMLGEGFSLKWMANNCSACHESGGQCGYDQTISTFSCFCPDRTHAHQCFLHTLKKKKGHLPLILGLVIASSLLIVAAFIAICWWKKLKPAHAKYVSRSNSLDQSPSEVEKGNIYFGVPLFSYNELREATDNFDESKELGDGGFGTVYYGKLKDGREVAVKRLYEKNYKRVEQFMNEVQLLTCLRHHNLVSLYGCTSHHSRELLLVYEYVSNGTVADHLYGNKAKDGSLSWSVRLKIATETANALCYLHASDIIHRDVKTNNILLDSSYSVKVADFGLSRLFPNDVTHISTAPQGTPGYLDPEYGECYQLTNKSDVYSFGVVLVELISSLPAIDFDRHRHEINLSNYAMTRIQRCAFEELVDPKLGFSSDEKVRRMTTSVGELAFQCLQHDKEFRPSMDEVLKILKTIQSTDYEALLAEEQAENDTGNVQRR